MTRHLKGKKRMKKLKIIDSYKEKEALELYRAGKMVDVLPYMNPMSRLDRDILGRWKKWFEYRDTPYLVLKERRKNPINSYLTPVYVLYKIDRVKYPEG